MAYSLSYSNQFKRDFKKILKRRYDISKLSTIFECLVKTATTPQIYKPHTLKGNYKNTMECHIEPDWLLIWQVDELAKEITLIRTGTHSDLF